MSRRFALAGSLATSTTGISRQINPLRLVCRQGAGKGCGYLNEHSYVEPLVMVEDFNRKFAKELNSGCTALALLSVIVNSPTPMYGYELGTQLASVTEDGLPMNHGALYPVLRSLERSGLLASVVEPSASGPPRRYYRPTSDGRRALKEWITIWNQTRNWVDFLLENKHGRTKRSPQRA
jgi:PadR family transcriptional regulator, regulatory protein PadR